MRTSTSPVLTNNALVPDWIFERTFVTPQCDFSGGHPLKTADACLSWTAVVAGAQEHVQSKEWSGSSYANFPMAVTKVFLKGHPKHFVLKPSFRENFSTTVAPSRSD